MPTSPRPPKYPNGRRTTLTCVQCGKSFAVPDCHAERVKCCSPACTRAYRKRPKPDGRRVTITCANCGRPFDVPQSHAARHKCCSWPCRNAYLTHYVELKCDYCGRTYSARPSQVKKGARFCSWRCRTYGTRGPGNKSWTNDPDYRGGPEWTEARRNALERDGHRCRNCAAHRPLIVHHIVDWHVSHDNSLGNLITLCISCHMSVHKGGLSLSHLLPPI